MEDLTAKQSVADLRLKHVLLKQEYIDYKEEYNGLREQKKELKAKPDEIIKYENMLKRASFYYNRGEGYSSKGKHKTAQQMLSKSDSHFERLYEYLQEITDSDAALWIYFDRTVTFDIENMPDLTPDSAPRVTTSQSHHNLNKYSISTLTQCKISAIERAILNLKYVINKEEESDEKSVKSSKLKDILYANNENLY